MFPRVSRSVFAVILAVFALAAIAPVAAQQPKKVDIKTLDPRYRQWLEDTTYIITREEKDAFLRLGADKERDAFIDRFWAIRNPNPGAPNNAFKDEHYARVAYANQYFGIGTKEGWRTDRGRVYITLGAPKQRAPYRMPSVTYPMEIWFYSSSHPALPPFFYVVFYQRDIGDEYRLYSPFMDGPQGLVTTDNNRGRPAQVLRMIDQEFGREVARTLISLIPDEPVDVNNPRPSMASDVMLNTIKDLANHPMSKEQLANNRRMLESVHSRVVLGDYLQVFTAALKDEDGVMNLHYALRLNSANDFALGKEGEKYYYNVTVTAKVSDANGKPLFTQETPLSQYLSEAEFAKMKGRPFGVEGRLPLAPGKYQIEFMVSNAVNRTAFKSQRTVVVPPENESGLRVSDIVPFTDAEQVDPREDRFLPFVVAGVKFTPTFQQDLDLAAGEDLKFFYQIWSGSAKTISDRFSVDYGYGRLGAAGSSKTVHDEFLRDQLDRNGSLVNGKKISTVDLPPGNYRLAVTLTDPGTQLKAYATSAFRLGGITRSVPPWDVYEQSGDILTSGRDELHRGITYEAQGDKATARQWYERALAKNANNEEARKRLAGVSIAAARP